MGMSASQARLIALTARMSDTEYEAQQVNQQRLTLSNQMNAVYETMCNMDVPTPPSKLDPKFKKSVYKDKSGNLKIKVNDDGTKTAYQTVKNGNIVQNAGAQRVSNVNDPKQYVNTSTIYSAEDFQKYDINDYREIVTAEDHVTEKWTDFDSDDYEYVTGYYVETVVDADENGVRVEKKEVHELTTPVKRQDLPEGTQYDLSGIKTDHYEGSRAVNSFANEKTYKSMNGGANISGTEAKAHNDSVDKLSNKKFVKAVSGGYEFVDIAAIKNGDEVYECTDPTAFQAAKTMIENGSTTGLTVGGRAVIDMNTANSTYKGVEAFEKALSGLKNIYPDDWNTAFSVLVGKDDKGNATFAFVKADDVNPNGAAGKDDTAIVYEYATGSYDEKIDNVPESDIIYDTNNNISSAKINGLETPLTIDSEFDEDAYDAAMSQYNSDKAVYDQEQDRLNKQTSIYQRQDKMLELKLTRLDNERNALNTEIEAVKKVIQDAIDRGFKTFSG